MAVPPEYTVCLNNLKAFRTKVLTDLVSARITAQLDAGHDGMTKYAGVVDGLSVTPYIFSKVREKALAVQFKGLDVESGGIVKPTQTFTGGLADYPMSPPFQVPQRKLPQVDVYLYEVLTDLQLLEKTDTSQLKTFILVQAPNDTFEESPDAENTFYDYYMMYPITRVRGEGDISEQGVPFTVWTKLIGEHVVFRRILTPNGTVDDKDYWLFLWLDSAIYSATDLVETPTVVLYNVYEAVTKPNVVFNVAGQRLLSTKTGIYAVPATTDKPFPIGFQFIASTLTFVSQDVTWRNIFKFTIEVNDVNMGYTNPAVGVYDKLGADTVSVTAYPYAGYGFDHWERDGVNKGSDNPRVFTIDKDQTVKAVFVTV